MQRFMATLHNALSVRKRPLSRNPESSYKQFDLQKQNNHLKRKYLQIDKY